MGEAYSQHRDERQVKAGMVADLPPGPPHIPSAIG